MASRTRQPSRRRAPAKRAPRASRPKSRYPEFIGEWPRLTGKQTPEFESRHPGDESEGDRCAQFGHNLANTYSTKTRCMPWQWSTVRGILSLKPVNEWGERLFTHRDVAIECTRQQGKTLIVVLLILFHLFVTPATGRPQALKIVYTAQRWSTAKDVYNRVVKVINRVPALKARLYKNPSIRDNHGVITVVTERDEDGNVIATAECEFAPRSQEFGRGVTELDILFLDEAYDLDPGIENDLTGAQSASENPQTIYLSTAPVFLKHPKCHSLADMHRLGFARAPLLFYQLFAAPRDLKRDDPKAWAAAQPSYGVATNELEIWSKRQKAKTAVKRAIFDADYCGWGDYPPPELEEETEITAEMWDAMGPLPDKPRPRLLDQTAAVIERCPRTKRWVIIGSQPTADGRVHIEIGYCEAVPVDIMVQRVLLLVTAWDPAVVAIRAKSDAAELLPKLEKAGIDATPVQGPDVARACGGFLSAAQDGTLSHSGQSDLADAVAAAQKKAITGGGFVWELVDESSFAQLMGASVAHWAITKFGRAKTTPPPPLSDNAGGDDHMDDSSMSIDDEFDAMSAAF